MKRTYQPPLQYCSRRGCSNTVRGRGPCEACRATASPPAAIEARRPSAAKRGYGRRWRAASKRHLQREPLCQMYCKDQGRVTAAEVVDHIIPHKGDWDLFWDRSNWQSGCAACHNRKTALENAANRTH